MKSRFRVEEVVSIAGLTTVEVSVLDGEIAHGDVAVDPTDAQTRLHVRTVAFVNARNRSTQARTLTVDPISYPRDRLIGKVLVCSG